MNNLTNERKEKLLAAKSVEEIAALLKAAGEDGAAAERIWEELCARRGEKELSLDELEAVSGGARNWATEGCASTVEPGSWCWSEDQCAVVVEFYDNAPINVNCSKCGMFFYKEIRDSGAKPVPVYYVCKACGHTQFAYWDEGSDKAK